VGGKAGAAVRELALVTVEVNADTVTAIQKPASPTRPAQSRTEAFAPAPPGGTRDVPATSPRLLVRSDPGGGRAQMRRRSASPIRITGAAASDLPIGVISHPTTGPTPPTCVTSPPTT